MTEQAQPVTANSLYRGNLRPLWRGALGGALGGLIHIFFIPVLNGERPLRSYFLFFALVYLLPFSAFTGAVIGAVVRAFNGKRQSRVGAIPRVAVGILFAAILGLIFSALMNERTLALTEPGRYLLGLAEYGVCVGVLAGIVIGKNGTKNPDL